MLSRLSIRDIVLIERLDIDYAAGLSVLTGETGAGKSILLDAFALALGSRGDASLVRQGAEQGQVTAAFDVEEDHPALALLGENGVATEDGLILRRVQLADGRTRAFVNDQPVSVQVLRALGAALVEIHGQHDDRAMVDVGSHRQLLDAYAGLESDAIAVSRAWTARRAAEAAVNAHRDRVEQARREADYLRHAVDELTKLEPETGEETLARRKAHRHDADRQGGGGFARCARGGRGRPLADRIAVGRAAPAGAAPRAGARADRSGDQGDRCRAHRARRGRQPSRRGIAFRRSRSARARPHRGAAVRAARRRAANTMSRWTISLH